MHLHTLTDDELLRYAHTVHDDLTSTPLETELLRRLTAQDGAAEAFSKLDLNPDSPNDLAFLSDVVELANAYKVEDIRAMRSALGAQDIDTQAELDDVLALNRVLLDNDIASVDELKGELQTAKDARQAMEDAAGPLRRLLELVPA